MPCYDPPPTREELDRWELDRWEKERVANELEKFSHNSPVAEMLCDVLDRLENDEDHAKLQNLPAKTLKWWKKHKERDLKKARAEQRKFDEAAKRERALLKLTPAERKLLGIR